VVLPGTTPTGGTPMITPTRGITPTAGATPTTVIVIERLPLTVIDVRFKTTWVRRGGLAIFGLPLIQPITHPNGVIVQFFEGVRLEYHPELPGSPVLLGLLAVELSRRRTPR
jgi:hypothetical protein